MDKLSEIVQRLVAPIRSPKSADISAVRKDISSVVDTIAQDKVVHVKRHGKSVFAIIDVGYWETLTELMETLGDKEMSAELRKAIHEVSLCKRCGTKLEHAGMRCQDLSCPFSDYDQSDSRGWFGHPNPPNEG